MIRFFVDCRILPPSEIDSVIIKWLDSKVDVVFGAKFSSESFSGWAALAFDFSRSAKSAPSAVVI